MATYANPSGNPDFATPGYNPNFGNQGFAVPGYSNQDPNFGSQGFAAPGYSNQDPNFGNQGFAAPGYSNQDPNFGSQGVAAPIYGNQGFDPTFGGNPGAAPLQVQQDYDAGLHRMDWRNPQPAAAWDSLPQERQDRKMREISAGGGVAEANEMFPASRPCQDPCLGVLFVLVAAGCLGHAAMNFTTAAELLSSLSFPLASPLTVIGTCMAGGTGSAFFVTVVYMLLMGRYPACVVWASLLLGPVITIAIGIVVLVTLPSFGLVIGGIMVALGICMLTCVFVCWRQFIPFTIEVVKVLARVMQLNPGMLLSAALCGIFGLAWSLGVFVTALAVAADYASENDQIDMGLMQIVAIPFVLVFYWGVQIAYYYSHTVLCGVFGRWYYFKDVAAPVRASIKVASTSSFGSIAKAAFFVALIRTLEFVIRQARRDAQQDGNLVACLVLCVLESIVRCVGDIMEWFGEWALVQVAVRGTSFFDSAKITFTMATCSNVDLIIADLLVDSVATLASLLCAGTGAAGGAVLMYFSGGGDGTLMGAGAVCGLLPGIMIGNAAGSLVTSGSKTILMSWAETPEELSRHHPDVAHAFARKCGPMSS